MNPRVGRGGVDHLRRPRPGSHTDRQLVDKPMLIMRKVFSSSFAISAASAELRWTVWIAPSYQAPATSLQAAVIAHYLGGIDGRKILATRVHTLGEKARNQSSPMVSRARCQASAAAAHASCRDTWSTPAPSPIPWCIYFASSSVAERMNDISGSPVWRSGVGTQMLTASRSFKTEKSAVAVRCPSGPASQWTQSSHRDVGNDSGSPLFGCRGRSRYTGTSQTQPPAADRHISPRIPTRAFFVFSSAMRVSLIDMFDPSLIYTR